MNNNYLQIAFNHTFGDFQSVIGQIPADDRIIIEAGTPLIKREGIGVVRKMRFYWGGPICADMKILDGAEAEVAMAKQAGAQYVTASGAASHETLRLFVETCRKFKIYSVIDMLGVENPMKVLWKSGAIPNVVFVHRGRDEENSYGKIIQYKDISKIEGKWDILSGAAGGIDNKELQSAIFNGANIVVVNVVKPSDPWKGIEINSEFKDNVEHFLQFVR